MTGTTFNLGTLRGSTTQQSTMFADGTTKRDIFKFKTSSSIENVSISTTGLGQVSSPFSLALFRDVNNNGVFDNGDLSGRIRLSDSGNRPNEANESLNANLTRGTYFAEAKAFASSNINYILRAKSSNTSANPLAAPEIQIGQISQDLRKADSVSDTDTADNFAFTLDGRASINIGVQELDNQNKGDVNIRVVQDLNGNGFVDNNEVVAKGVSTLKGNVDTITGLNKAGDYILQVCQTSGSSRFGVNFDHSVA